MTFMAVDDWMHFWDNSLNSFHIKATWAQVVPRIIDTLRLRQHGRHLTDNIFKCIFLNGNVWISLKISLKFVPKVWINNIPAFVQIMAWRRPDDKPLSEAMMVVLLMHISVTWPQRVKPGTPSAWFNKKADRNGNKNLATGLLCWI